MKLFILPFDHRSSFLKILEKPNKKKVETLKQIIFIGFLKVYEIYKPKKDLAILIDEKYGEKIISFAKENKIKLCLPIEKSGKEILELEYKDLKEVQRIKPDYLKVLVRYNPLNVEINEKQDLVLKNINSFCQKNKYKLILELLVPPTKEDLKLATDYDKNLRLVRTCQAIEEIQSSIKVDIWKLEGFNKKGWEEINKVIKNRAKIIFLGRGESKEKVKKWLLSSKKIKNIIGFAIGRTVFMNPLQEHLKGNLTADETSSEIAKNFKYFINLFNK